MLIMVTGVSSSGKSEYAEQISCQLAKDNKKYYVATMYPYGEDGRSRVKKHKLQRDGKGFETIEQYQNIGGALKGCKREKNGYNPVQLIFFLLMNALKKTDIQIIYLLNVCSCIQSAVTL